MRVSTQRIEPTSARDPINALTGLP